jgi:uncharacterized protein (TIGR02099 family)
MPVARAHLSGSALVSSRAARFARLCGALLVAATALFCVLLLAVRFVVFPRIDDYRGRITDWLSVALGQPVAMQAIDTGWDGWNPRLSIRGFAIRDRNDPGGAPLLDLPGVDMVVSWSSLVFFDLRLKELTISRPEIAVRRDARGRLHFAGIEIDPERQGDDTRVTDWLLRQRQIIVEDALVTWSDELRHAPQLVLDHVHFRFEEGFRVHRFGLVGTPPASLAAPLDFRGEVADASLKDWGELRGKFYARLDFADVALWQEWIPLPVRFESGKGALRVWSEFAGGRPTGIVMDLELTDVSTRLAPDLPRLDLAHIAGRVDWKVAADTRELTTTGLTFTSASGLELAPTNLSFALRRDEEGTVTGGRLAFDQIDVAPLTMLAAHLPLPEAWRRDVSRLGLRGTVAEGKLSWAGSGDVPEQYAASGTLQRITMAPQDAIPGASGLSGRFALDQNRGELVLDSRALKLDAPQWWSEPLALDSAAGTVRWDKADARWRVTLEDLRVAGARMSGAASGIWRALPAGPGALSLRAQLSGTDAPTLARFLPLHMDSGLRDWLKTSIRQGTASDVRLTLDGDLADFPFPENRGGRFLVTCSVKGATLAYLPNWPAIEDINADLKLEGARLTVDATHGQAFGAQLGPTRAEIANLLLPFPMLALSGTATGATTDFLEFVARSPLAGEIGKTGEEARVTGNGKLALRMQLPLGKDSGGKIAGEYELVGNRVQWPGVPALSQLRGRLSFTENDLQSQELVLETLGGPAKMTIANANGQLRITGAGTANLAMLRSEFDMPVLARLSGSTDWQFNFTSRAGTAAWTLDSTLQGAVIGMPAPVGKTAAEAAPLKLERRAVPGRSEEEVITADYRGVLRLIVHRGPAVDGMAADRVLLLLGSAIARGGAADRPGIWVRGKLPEFDMDEWLALYAKESPRPTGTTAPPRLERSLEINGIDLEVGRLDVFGRVLHDLTASAQRSGDDWQLALRGREVDGNAVWRGPSAQHPNGRVMARLTRLVPPGPGEINPQHSELDPTGAAANPWPELDIVADAFVSKGHDLGKLELDATPIGADWRIRKLSLASGAGRIDASGWWRVQGDKQETQIDAALTTEDAGAYLARFGYPDAVHNAPTKITGSLAWKGAPNDFDYPTLTGNFKLESGAGQFTKIDPGIGKLLGVLSLQALPRRITLDFRDVFSEGFAFDYVKGDFRIASGQMHTDDLKLAGPAAAVAISGDIDLAQETQRLAVRVQPSLSTGVSAGAAVLFLANPIVGAAVGAGALLAQKLLNNPIDQLFSYDYRISGSWVDPVVERVTGRAVPRLSTAGPEPQAPPR